jgi:hypothetical protein
MVTTFRFSALSEAAVVQVNHHEDQNQDHDQHEQAWTVQRFIVAVTWHRGTSSPSERASAGSG